MEGWHTFGLWWKPDEYIFYVDGKETWRTKAGGVCQVPEYIKLSDEIGNWGGDIKKATLPDQFLWIMCGCTTWWRRSARHCALQVYQLDVGSHPTTQQGLNALRLLPSDLHEPEKWAGPYLSKNVPLDPWGKPYHYRLPGVHNPKSFDLWSVSPRWQGNRQLEVTNGEL